MKALPVIVALLMVVAPIAGAVAPAGASIPAAEQPTDGSTVAQTDGGESAGDGSASADDEDDGVNDGNGDDGSGDDENGDDEGEGGTIEPADAEDELTFRVLSTPPDADPRTGTTMHGANIGTSLGLDVADVDAALETEAVVRGIENADTSADRQRRILAAVNQVEQDEVSLHSRQLAAINAHAAGDLSDRELLDELVTIAAVASEYDERLDVLDELADETDGFSSPSRLDELQVQLQVYEGPVRAEALAAVRGETGGSNIHIETSDGAVVLATVDEAENRYVREVVRDDRWDRGGGSVSSEDAINVTAASYPETAALREADAFGAGSVHRVTVAHDFGELRTFVSGGTDQVFIEYQRIDLETFPDFESVSTTGDGFNVTVDRSYAGGPVVVSVTDAEDGTPIDGVTVTKSVGGGDSEAIGTTDADGTIRTLSPADSYRITVVDEPRVAVVDGITPTETPRLVDDQPSEESETD